MGKQEQMKNQTGPRTMDERYYVQSLTDQVFLIRERVSVDGETSSNDRIVRSFTMRHDAYMYAGEINDAQRKLDESHGHWVQSAGER